MREISSREKESLDEAIFTLKETGRNPISISSLEKDIHVTAALKSISKIESDEFLLVFSGGTCLSKAHRLVDRFSEDIDIKIISKNPQKSETTSGLRKAISELKESVDTALLEAGFDTGVTGKSRNGNRHTEYLIDFHSNFEKNSELRDSIKLELVKSECRNGCEKQSINFLYNQLLLNDTGSFDMMCISVEETFAEKLISFGRRTAKYLDQNEDHYDNTLVRHLYDIHIISTLYPEIAKKSVSMSTLVQEIVYQDAVQFENQHPQFLKNSAQSLKSAVNFSKGSPEMAQNYESFLKNMVYGSEAPSFSKALEKYESALRLYIPGYNQAIDLRTIANPGEKLTAGSFSKSIESMKKLIKDDSEPSP